MALGAVGLGYGHPSVAEAVARAVGDGAVQPLPPTLEVEVAERLCAAYPGAEQARFFKTGAEAVAGAVRIARVVTGRPGVVACGYHGWLDGATTGTGVPVATSDLWHAVPFDDVEALERATAERRPAAIVLEPVIERAPAASWLQAARTVATRHGALLVFDEIKTAFRLARGGAAERWSVTPDLAALGKALANGFPLAAVVGRADLMARVRETWISSTLATEAVSLAAADAVLRVWSDTDVHAELNRVGSVLLAGLRELAVAHPAARLTAGGLPEMSWLRFESGEEERRFLLACAERGVLLRRGAYNFPSLAHTSADVTETLAAARAALEGVD